MAQSSPEVKKAWSVRNAHKLREINRNWTLRNVYGITPEQFDVMYQGQGGKCAICLRELQLNVRGYNELHVDHDHSTGYVRGLLCSRCNLAIGQFEDNVTFLQSAVLYLQYRKTPDDFVFSKQPNPQRKHTDEWKATASERSKGNKYRAGVTAWNKGTVWSAETRTRMSESAKTRANTPEGKAHLVRANNARKVLKTNE